MKSYGRPKANGYCCIWCDGPYDRHKHMNRRRERSRARQAAKKEIRKQKNDDHE